MFVITDKEIQRNSFEKAYNEGFYLFEQGLFFKDSIKKITGKNTSIIYYGTCRENNNTYNLCVEVNNQDRIHTYFCSCKEVGHYVGGMCRHLVAFCFAIMHFFQNDNLNFDDNQLKQLEERRKQEDEERRLKALEYKKKQEIKNQQKDFNKLIESYEKLNVGSSSNFNVHLLPQLMIGKSCVLSLKIGIDKMYVVKNIGSFIASVMNEDEVSYGKKLTFNHKIDNFDEPSKKLISLLSGLFIKRYGIDLGREIFINKYLLSEIIDIYKGTYVDLIIESLRYHDFESFLIANESFNFKLNLDQNGILKINNISEKYYFIADKYRSYFINDNIIYPDVKTNDDLQPLVEYLLDKKEIDVNNVLDSFVTNLYPRIFEYVDVDDHFKEAHPMKMLRIDSFFDLDDGVIEFTQKYYLDDEEISLEMLKKYPFNTFKLQRYNNIIADLGFEEIQKDDKVEMIISDAKQIVDFMHRDLSFLKEFGEVYLSDNLKRVSLKKMTKGQISIKYGVDILSVCFSEFGFSDEELYKLLNGFKSKKKFVKLSKDSIVEVDEELVGQLSEVVEELSLDPKHLNQMQSIPLYHSFKLNEEDNDYYSIVVDEQIRPIISEIKNFKNANYDLSFELNNRLRPYQKEAFNWLKIITKYKFGGVLADDMGLGKTLEMISLISSDDSKLPTLIVCPKSLTFNWKNEIEKWDKSLDALVIYGNAFDRINMINGIGEEKRIYITSYDSLRNDVNLYENKKFRFIVLDEGQFIKNSGAQKTKAVKSLNGEVRFVLTGTPIENSLGDLWSIFDFIMPGYLGNYKNFKEKYEAPIIYDNNRDILEALVKKITPFVLRRTKEEVLKDLPEKFETIHYAFMGEDQRKVYESYLYKAREDITTGKSSFEVLSLLTRLRQICVDPSMFIDNYLGDSCKVELCVELIKDYINNNHRILVFSQFKSIFPTLMKAMDQEKIKYFTLTGETNNAQRMEMVSTFNSNDEYKVFFISLKAGGTGLNLVGADTVIHLDPWWNVSAQNQATDRAHRIGQIHTVNVIKIICADSIEQKVLELQELKKDLSNKVITNNDENILKLDNNDLNYLLY